MYVWNDYGRIWYNGVGIKITVEMILLMIICEFILVAKKPFTVREPFDSSSKLLSCPKFDVTYPWTALSLVGLLSLKNFGHL